MNFSNTDLDFFKNFSEKQFLDMFSYGQAAYALPLDYIIQNAGLNLAYLISILAPKNSMIQFGIGDHDTGWIGMVAAQRLAIWDYKVFFHSIDKDIKYPPLIKKINYAINYGVIDEFHDTCDVWVDTYKGYIDNHKSSVDQKKLQLLIEKANKSSSLKVSKDLPTKVTVDGIETEIHSKAVLSCIYPTLDILSLIDTQDLYVGSVGFPEEIYKKYSLEIPHFDHGHLIKIKK